MNYPFVINENDIQETNIGWFIEEFKNLNDKGFEMRITDILKRNGWEFVEDGDYGATWKKDFCVMYTTTVHAVIGYKPEHIGGAWQYGLQWLECEYEYHDQEHGRRDLEDMYDGMRIALEHLLAKGIFCTFVPDEENPSNISGICCSDRVRHSSGTESGEFF